MKKLLSMVLILLTVGPCRLVFGMQAENTDTTLFKLEEPIVQVFSSSDQRIPITEKDVHLMAQIVYAESNAEPFEGKIAVASVILNRLRYPAFPKTVAGVVTQNNAFSCLINGEIKVEPNESCFLAVNEALKGNDPTGNAMFFYNPKIATSPWMKNVNKKNIKTIGNHVFFVAE